MTDRTDATAVVAFSIDASAEAQLARRVLAAGRGAGRPAGTSGVAHGDSIYAE
jgi:hypothetical protein